MMKSFAPNKRGLEHGNTFDDGCITGNEVIIGDDPLDAQLKMSCDRLVNKMLYYLAQISIQRSFFSLIPRFSELVLYTRFEDYMDNFF